MKIHQQCCKKEKTGWDKISKNFFKTSFKFKKSLLLGSTLILEQVMVIQKYWHYLISSSTGLCKKPSMK